MAGVGVVGGEHRAVAFGGNDGLRLGLLDHPAQIVCVISLIGNYASRSLTSERRYFRTHGNGMHIRTANPNDLAAIETLLGQAYPVLMAASYDADTLAAALPVMVRANPELLASGSFYAAEESGRVVGCGGWTFEQPGSGRLEDGLAHLRHFATDPDMVRRGIGRSIFERCAAEAVQRGARVFQAFAGLNAESFYRSLGLVRRNLANIPLGPTATLQAVLMEGPIPRP